MTDSPRKYSFFPKSLERVIEPLTRPVFKAQGLAGTKLIGEWDKVVGHDLARRTVPVKLSFPRGQKTGGTLTLAVENGFATELHYMQPVILEKIATYYGYAAVSRIMLAASPLPAAKEKPPRARAGTLPPSCMDTLEQIEDAELREALASLGKTLSNVK